MIVSETQPPPISAMFADTVERGLDPWHPDAFKGIPGMVEDMKHNGGTRASGWFFVDWCGNYVGFVADGTEIVDPPTDVEHVCDCCGEKHCKCQGVVTVQEAYSVGYEGI